MASQDQAPASGPPPTVDPSTGHAQEIEAQVIAQAVQDAAFRARVVADPKAAFAEMGLRIPTEVQVQTLEESADQYYLVLPAPARLASRPGTSLTETQLESVAGGSFADPTSVTEWTGCASGQSGCVSP